MTTSMYDRIIRITDDPVTGRKLLWIVSRTAQGRTVSYSDREETFTEGAAAKPSLFLTDEDLPLLMNELSRLGVKLPEQSKVEGLYEAQSEHLRDLRKLLKL